MEDATPKIENREFLEDKWFETYLKANKAIPFTGDGLSYFTMIETVLESENTDWLKFLKSEFSPAQIKLVTQRMEELHLARGVQVSTEEGKEAFENPRIIGEEVNQLVWTQTKTLVLNKLHAYISGFNVYVTATTPSQIAFHADEIYRFFKNPMDRQKVVKLKKALQVIKESLEDPGTGKILTEYKADLSSQAKAGKKPEELTWEAKYRERLRNIILEKANSAFDGAIPDDVRGLFY